MPRLDPVATFNFLVVLVGDNGPMPAASFASCSGLEAEMEIETYQQGGDNDRVYRFQGPVDYPNLVLSRGMTVNPVLRRWHMHTREQIPAPRYDGFVVLQNEGRQPVAGWRWERGLLVKLTGPELDANESEVAVETAEIAHERLVSVEAEMLPV